MHLRSTPLVPAILIVVLDLCCARAQPAAEPLQSQNPRPPSGKQSSDFEEPAYGVKGFLINGDVIQDDREAALRYLLASVNPAQVAAEVLKVPKDKIALVPRIYWLEPKWLDWARKANESRKSQPNYEPKTGPDDKIPVEVDVLGLGNGQVVVHLGPWNLAGDDAALIDRIAQRVVVEMVRNSEEQTRSFFREREVKTYDRLKNRLRDLDDETDKLARQLRDSEGLLLSQSQLSERLADLQRQVLATNLSIDVLKARKDATSEEFEKLKLQSQAKAAENETLHTLKRIVELRKARFDRVKALNSQGVAPREEADKAEEEMLSAMVDLDRATAAAQKSESQTQLDALAADLSKIAVDRAEAEARVKFLLDAREETATELNRRRDADLAASRLRAQLKDKEGRRAELQQQLNAAEDRLNSPSPYLQLSAGF
jgi:hypothetical protein